MKKIIFLLSVLASLMASAQQLPQFAYDNFVDWTYNNPEVPLSSQTIGDNKIVLYVDSQGRVLTLSSPEFQCQGMDSIQATIGWHTPGFSNSGYDLNKATLTIAIDDIGGHPMDSVTCTTPKKTRYQLLHLTLPVPQGLHRARLRFLSWTGDVVSSGAIRSIKLDPVTSSGHEVVIGDVDNDGVVSISDVTTLIDLLLNGNTVYQESADVDCDGTVSISDVTTLIDKLLTGV